MLDIIFQIAIALAVLLLVTVPGAPLVAALGGRRALPAALLPAVCAAMTLTLVTAALVPALWNGWPVEIVLAVLLAAFIVGYIIVRIRASSRRSALAEVFAVTPFGVIRDIHPGLRAVAAFTSVWAFLLGGWLDDGDMMYHTAIARKLAELRSPTFSTIQLFADGSLHPGYPAPPWHAVVALTSSITTADVATVMWVASAAMAPIAALAAAGLAQVVFRSSLAGIVSALVFVALDGFARAPLFGAIGGANSPNAISTQTLLPVCLALYLVALWHPIRSGRRSALALLVVAGVPSLVAVHASYLAFLGIAVAGYLVIFIARWPIAWPVLRRHLVVSAALGVTTVAGLLALRPALSELVTFQSKAAQAALRTELAEYAGIIVGTPAGFHLRIDMLAWFGGMAGIGLICALLSVLRPREPVAWLLIGATGAVLLVTQVDFLFTALSKAASTHQTKRILFAVPTELAITMAALFVAAACGRWRLRGMRLIPMLLAALVGMSWAVLVQYWPPVRDFKAPPEIPLWPISIIAFMYIPAALFVALSNRGPAPEPRDKRPSAVEAAGAADPGAASRAILGIDVTRPVIDVRRGASIWAVLVVVIATIPLMPDAARSIKRGIVDRPSSALHAYALAGFDPGAVRGLRNLPTGNVVLAPPHPWGLRVQAVAPVYSVGVRVTHVARTVKNRPVARREAAERFYAPGSTNLDRVNVLRDEKVDAIFLPGGFATGAAQAFVERYPNVFTKVSTGDDAQSVWEVSRDDLTRIPTAGGVL